MKSEFYAVAWDRMRSLPDHRTKTYETWAQAHEAGERLCKRHFAGDRGGVLIVEVEVGSGTTLEV